MYTGAFDPGPIDPRGFADISADAHTHDSTVGSEQQGTPLRSMSTGEQILVGVVVLAVLGGAGWLIYKQAQLTQTIAEKEGSSGIIKMTAAQTASRLITGGMGHHHHHGHW